MIQLSEIKKQQKIGLIDYYWKLRQFLIRPTKMITKSHKDFINIVLQPFLYVEENKNTIKNDKSLNAVCQVCTNIELVVDTHLEDKQLSYYAKLFNKTVGSDRELSLCYDCGTVARGLFFQLIKAYRGKIILHDDEIQRIKDEYYMSKYQGADGVKVLQNRLHTIHKNSLFLCAMQLGNDFGHIYLIEKIYKNKNSKPRFRIYQSCLNAYLLIDYIYSMDYINVETGVNIDDHLSVINELFSKSAWKQREINSFIKWFKFYPTFGQSKDEVKLFTSTYIIF